MYRPGYDRPEGCVRNHMPFSTPSFFLGDVSIDAGVYQ